MRHEMQQEEMMKERQQTFDQVFKAEMEEYLAKGTVQST